MMSERTPKAPVRKSRRAHTATAIDKHARPPAAAEHAC